jgi:SAM-dependent methyltransferase
MDLRPLIKSKRQIDAARGLALRGLLSYQPYIFSDNFAVGAGLSIVAGFTKDPPAVYCPDATADETDPAFFAREFAKEDQREEFFSANAAMRRLYDHMIEQTADAVGPLQKMSVLDVGCNTGYFPIAFARKGARRTTGIDRIDYSPTVALLNEICGTSVRFAPWNYDGSLTSAEQHDLVLSVAVLVHLSEPLRHLAWLGSCARKALMVFTPCHLSDDYSIKFHAVNRYYDHDEFPHCFDVTTLSRPLLRLAFEKMGFSRIVEITAAQDVMSPQWTSEHLGLLGIREG